MRIFKTKSVARFAKGEHISDSNLAEAIERAEKGLVDADLGGGLIKQRIARKGQGKSGGFRMIVAYRIGDKAVFLYGFAKSGRDNIKADELEKLREVGASFLTATADMIAMLQATGRLEEIEHDEEKLP